MGKPYVHVWKQQGSPSSVRVFFFLPISLAITTLLLIFIYQYTTSDVLMITNPLDTIFLEPSDDRSSEHFPFSFDNTAEDLFFDQPMMRARGKQLKWSIQDFFGSTTGESSINNTEVYHDFDNFEKEYKDMNKSFKIYVYPHSKDHPFANVLGYDDHLDSKAHYASELYFKKALLNSHFITKNPSEADLFYLPFSVAGMRFDPRIGPEGMHDFIRDYLRNVSHNYPYWNRTGGADHFYVACHWVEKIALDLVVEAKLNAIQVVCSSTYFFRGYFAHKDFSMPQIWPKERDHDPPNLHDTSKRKQLAFFSGSISSPVRAALRKYWRNDTDILTSFRRSRTDNGEQQLRSKFCLHVKGYEVNTVSVTDAIHYGCVPVILANQYDLPLADILNWRTFSVVVHYIDIPVLKKILQGITFDHFALLQTNVLKVRKHFKWNVPPLDYDAFNMAMFELWLRRSSVRIYDHDKV